MMLQSFPTTVGVSQGCLLSPLLFNLFLESIVRETLYKIHSTISVGGRIISDMRFAGDIDPLGGSNNKKKKVPPRTHLQTRPTRKHAWEKANSWLIKNLPTTTLPWMETEWKKLRLSISLCQQPLQRIEDQQLRSEWDSGNSRNDQTQKIMEMQKEHLSNKSQTTRRRWSQEIKLSKISTYSSQNTEANTLLGNL